MECPPPEFYKVNFNFDGEDYAVIPESDYIKLPDGRVLKTTMWLESYPPQPGGLHVVEAPVETMPLGIAQFSPKTVNFEYEGQEYCATRRVYRTQYVVLPDQKVLEVLDYKFNPDYIKFREVEINIAEQHKDDVIKADLKQPVNKLKM